MAMTYCQFAIRRLLPILPFNHCWISLPQLQGIVNIRLLLNLCQLLYLLSSNCSSMSRRSGRGQKFKEPSPVLPNVPRQFDSQNSPLTEFSLALDVSTLARARKLLLALTLRSNSHCYRVLRESTMGLSLCLKTSLRRGVSSRSHLSLDSDEPILPGRNVYSPTRPQRPLPDASL